MLKHILFVCLFCVAAHSAVIEEKVLICGICKNIEKSVPNTIASIEHLGSQFSDYRVIIYENNSKDETKKLLKIWAKTNSRITFLSEKVSKKQLIKDCGVQKISRTVALARARNKVLDRAMAERYEGFKYVIWADLDFQDPWDVSHVVETILTPEQEWDAVLANGSYDLFAFRDPQFPVGFELMGNRYWDQLNELRALFSIDSKEPWKKVYSAFGGLGIYKREALKGSHYSGNVTKDLETMMLIWLQKAKNREKVCFLDEYEQRLVNTEIIDLTEKEITERNLLSSAIGIRLHNANGLGKIAWFSCTENSTLPWTCEHIPLHASMALKGYDKIFVNPRLISNHP